MERLPLDTPSAAVRARCSFLSWFRQSSQWIWLLAGARQIVTGLSIAKDANQKIFVTSMCIGTGMGMAALFVSEQN